MWWRMSPVGHRGVGQGGAVVNGANDGAAMVAARLGCRAFARSSWYLPSPVPWRWCRCCSARPARAAKKANDARAAFHDEMGALLAGDEVTTQTLRHRELLRRLDVTGLRLASAADALISGALKRG